jgi:hypothetical protein
VADMASGWLKIEDKEIIVAAKFLYIASEINV